MAYYIMWVVGLYDHISPSGFILFMSQRSPISSSTSNYNFMIKLQAWKLYLFYQIYYLKRKDSFVSGLLLLARPVFILQ